MRELIEGMARSYFDRRRAEFGENATYSAFLIETGDTTVENVYPVDVFGYVTYRVGTLTLMSGRLRVQYYQFREDHPNLLWISQLTANEFVFHNQIWPLCANDATRDSVAKFCDFAHCLCGPVSMGAFLFEHDGALHTGRTWSYAHMFQPNYLRLMASTIGEYHGRVLETRRLNLPELSLRTNELFPMVFDVHQVVPLLTACIDLVDADDQTTRERVLRLRQMVARLPDLLETPPPVNLARLLLVVGHRNYWPYNCSFRYNAVEPTAMVIGFWGWAAWASLADDLVCLLFLDASLRSPAGRFSLHLQFELWNDYMEGLREGCPRQNAVPTSMEVWGEIKRRIPFMLMCLAHRVLDLSGTPIPGDPQGRLYPWDVPFIAEVYNVLIYFDLV